MIKIHITEEEKGKLKSINEFKNIEEPFEVYPERGIFCSKIQAFKKVLNINQFPPKNVVTEGRPIKIKFVVDNELKYRYDRQY